MGDEMAKNYAKQHASGRLIPGRSADTLGAARKAGLHLSCGHDDKALSTAECILDNIGEKVHMWCMLSVSSLVRLLL